MGGLSDTRPVNAMGQLTPEQLAMLQQSALMNAGGPNGTPAMPMGLAQQGAGLGMQQNIMQDPNMLLAAMSQPGGFYGMPRR